MKFNFFVGGSEKVEILVACNLDNLQQKIESFSVQPFMVENGFKVSKIELFVIFSLHFLLKVFKRNSMN